MKQQQIPIHANKVLAVLLAVVCIILALPALAASGIIDQRETFATQGIELIDLSAASTPVHVTLADAGTSAAFHLHGDAPKKIWLETDLTGGVLTVREEREAIVTFAQEHIALDVTLPADYTQGLTIRTASGDITVDAITLSRLTLDSTSGAIRLAPVLCGQVALTSTSGALDAQGITADALTIESTSGDVRVGGLSAQDVSLRCTSAQADLTFAAFGSARLNVVSTSGRIKLTLPAEAGFRFDITRTSALIHSDFEAIALFGQEPDTLRGQVGDGSGVVSIASTSGDIEILHQ